MMMHRANSSPGVVALSASALQSRGEWRNKPQLERLRLGQRGLRRFGWQLNDSRSEISLLRVSVSAADADGGSPVTTSATSESQSRNFRTAFSPNPDGAGQDEAKSSYDLEPEVFTKFIDERLLEILHNKSTDSPVRQTVLLTGGTDTRPYHLQWPNPSLVFDVSPGPVYSVTSRQQKELGLKVARSCLLQHVSVDFENENWIDEDLVEQLQRKGYRGDAPSAWVIQISTAVPEQSLQRIVAVASCLLMKGSTIFGVVPSSSVPASKAARGDSLRSLFVGHGFSLQLHPYEELASKWGLDAAAAGSSVIHSGDLLAVVAKQERLSDVQVEMGRKDLDEAEEVEEDGFEDSW